MMYGISPRLARAGRWSVSSLVNSTSTFCVSLRRGGGIARTGTSTSLGAALGAAAFGAGGFSHSSSSSSYISPPSGTAVNGFAFGAGALSSVIGSAAEAASALASASSSALGSLASELAEGGGAGGLVEAAVDPLALLVAVGGLVLAVLRVDGDAALLGHILGRAGLLAVRLRLGE
eukprot:1192271-Prorocentrum_minimum.AAC.3